MSTERGFDETPQSGLKGSHIVEGDQEEFCWWQDAYWKKGALNLFVMNVHVYIQKKDLHLNHFIKKSVLHHLYDFQKLQEEFVRSPVKSSHTLEARAAYVSLSPVPHRMACKMAD